MTKPAEPRTLQEAVKYFSDKDICLAEMIQLRWGAGPIACPTCGSVEVFFLKSRRVWECKEKHPKRQFSVKVGTLMEDSPIGLDKWLVTMWLIANAKNGISSYEVSRSIGVTQKSAWFMLHRIRLAMQDQHPPRFEGNVEADETFIGGKARNMHRDKRERVMGTKKHPGHMLGKVAVMGILERTSDKGHSRVVTTIVQNVRRFPLQLELRRRVKMDGTATIYTDALKSYDVPKTWGPTDLFIHKVVDHAARYAEGIVHTNGMENYWSLLKRTLKGTYVSVEPFHLFRYLDEQAFRFNHRKTTDRARFVLAASHVFGKRLTYAALTGRKTA